MTSALPSLILSLQQNPSQENRDKAFAEYFPLVEVICNKVYSRNAEAIQVGAVSLLHALQDCNKCTHNFETWLKVRIRYDLDDWRHKNRLLSVPKKSYYRHKINPVVEGGDHVYDICADVENPLDTLIIKEWLQALTLTERTVCDYYSRGSSIAQIGKLVGLPRNTVSDMLARIRDSLTWKPE